ncbi:MAG: SpoIIIAH-like family protein [Faecousia sp.]
MKTWKKNLVAAAVLVTVCAGIYVNWMYSEAENTANLTDTLDAEKIMGETTLVMGTDDALETAGNLDNNTATDYFAAVRLSRQEARDSAIGLLQETMSYGDDSGASDASNRLDQLVQTALSEATIESLVVAKGYSDCVAYMSDTGISVAVAAPEGGLQQEDVAVITDIVLSQSSYEVPDIHVVEVR